MTYKHWGLMAFGLLFAIAAGFWLQHKNDAKLAPYKRKAAQLDDFCRATRIGHDTMLRALEIPANGDVTTPSIAADIIDRDIAQFGYTSVRTCLGEKAPTQLDGLAFCRIEKNYACIADQTRIYRDALIKGGW